MPFHILVQSSIQALLDGVEYGHLVLTKLGENISLCRSQQIHRIACLPERGERIKDHGALLCRVMKLVAHRRQQGTRRQSAPKTTPNERHQVPIMPPTSS